nr:outer dense fiber protein 3-B isoform X1 [Nothobranchius furzeri]
MSRKDPWVGTWRPHKPRGPIAALYGSPGPKYALSGLTGSFQHDPTKPKAPMFSFGGRHQEIKTDCSPGPGYLYIPSNITTNGRNDKPAFSIQWRKKQPKWSEVPGPGEYCPEKSEKMTFRSAPAYSLHSRRRDVVTSHTPGPDTYTLPPMVGSKTVTGTSAPTYSICGRRKTASLHEELKQTPGPAAYKVVDSCIFKQKPPQYSIKGRTFVPNDATDRPGPGAHYPELVTCTRTKAPSFTFGVRHSEYTAPLIVPNNEQ